MKDSTVVITGAGSGIGRTCVAALAERGFDVIGTARDEAEREAMLSRGDAVRKVAVFDVAQEDEVELAALRMEPWLEGRRLGGVVNSAGIVVAGPLELLPDDALRRQFAVNVFGLMSVTRAFLPRLRRDRGRVVQLGSVGGRLSVPFTGAYNASKFAVRGLSDALRVELRPAGVHVALVEPGPVATPIWETSIAAGRRLIDRLGARATELYGREIEAMEAASKDASRQAIEPEDVAAAVVHALSAERPRANYLVGANAHVQTVVSFLPPRVRDPLLRRVLGLDG